MAKETISRTLYTKLIVVQIYQIYSNNLLFVIELDDMNQWNVTYDSC